MNLTRLTPTHATLLALLVALAGILSALAFQHIGGYAPCDLCLKQRYAYYAGIPLAALALGLLAMKSRTPATMLLWLVALAFAANAVLGVYHSGVEWKWWPGPESCAGGDLGNIGTNLLEAIQNAKPVSCNDAPWRLLGLSFAGWNVVVSLCVALLAAVGIRNSHAAG